LDAIDARVNAMNTAINLSDLYRGQINLWVEDPLTKSYLAEIWEGDPAILFLIGGGVDGVRSVIEDARNNNFHNVFGLIDRDFRESNYSAWLDPKKNPRTFVLPVHELENFLLDPDALAGCDVNNLARSADEIVELLQTRARELCWWMACRDVIFQYAGEFRNNFTGHPAATIKNEQEAHAHICESEWFTSFAEKANRVDKTEVSNRLNNAYAEAILRIQSGRWRNEFAGKELFRDIRSRIYDSREKVASPTVLDSDVALSIAQWQLANEKVPDELKILREALKMRCGIQ
jgi:hypothetical protein